MMKRLSVLLVAVLVLLSSLAFMTNAKKTPKQLKKDEDVLEASMGGLLEEMNRDLNEKRTEAAANAMKEPDPKELKKQRDEMKKLEKEAIEYTAKADLAKEGFGEISEERATMLHSLGRAVYKLGRFTEALKHSREILRIYEKKYGVDSKKVVDALGNVAAVANRIQNKKLVTRVMKRAVWILRKIYIDEGTPELLMHRAKMLQFKIEDAATTKGITYEEYLEEEEEENGNEL